MTATTAYERRIRRWDVIRLRAQGFTIDEIAEETGFSPQTIRNDLDRINDELSKLDDPEFLHDTLRRSAMHVLEHEYEDIQRAHAEQDEQAKHRAKQSMRATLKLIRDIEDDVETHDVGEDDSWFENLPEDVKEKVSEAASGEVERILSE